MSKLSLIVIGVLLIACASGGSNKENFDGDKFHQYYLKGKALYLQHCSNCHQADGSGLRRVIPPLQHSDYVDNHFDEVICLMRFGKQGEITVNGVHYNQPMPENLALGDAEIAQIATYLYNSWKRDKGLVTMEDAAHVLNQCGR